MYAILKNGVCVGVNSLLLNEAELADGEDQIELKDHPDNPMTLLGKVYISGEFVEPEKTTREKQLEENYIQTLFLSDTDWKVIRHRDQLSLGVETSLTEAEYKELLKARQKARDAVVEMDFNS